MEKEEKATEEEIKKHMKFHEAMAEYQGKKHKEAVEKYLRENE